MLSIATAVAQRARLKEKLKTSDVYKKSAVVESIAGGTLYNNYQLSGFRLEKKLDEYLDHGALGAKGGTLL